MFVAFHLNVPVPRPPSHFSPCSSIPLARHANFRSDILIHPSSVPPTPSAPPSIYPGIVTSGTGRCENVAGGGQIPGSRIFVCNAFALSPSVEAGEKPSQH
eukprot:5639418-Pyramimonas_sp.AAC.1